MCHSLYIYTTDLFSGEQRDGRHSVGVLVAFGCGHLLEEIHLLLAGQEDDFGVTEHHDGVCQLVAEEPRLRDKKGANMSGSGGFSQCTTRPTADKTFVCDSG